MDLLISDFLSVPDEILMTEVFPRLPVDILSRLCSVHTKFNDICNNDAMWQIKFKYDFPDVTLNLLPVNTWKQYYRLVALNSRLVPVLADNQLITIIRIFNTDSIGEIRSKLGNKIKTTQSISFQQENGIIKSITLSNLNFDTNRIRSSRVLPGDPNSSYNIMELKSIAHSLNIPISGNKKVLVNRIRTYLGLPLE